MTIKAGSPTNPGPIQLGQLISSIQDPGYTIGTLPPLNPEDHGMKPSILKASGATHTSTTTSAFFLNAFLKAVELIGLEHNTCIQSATSLISAVEYIEAHSITPLNDYVRASLQREAVQTWLRESWGRRRVYMVCGVLIARPKGDESKVSIAREHLAEVSGAAEGHGVAAQAPVGAGAGAGIVSSKGFGLAFVPKTAFVYAFSLRECFFRKGEGSSKLFLKGAKLHAAGKASESGKAEREDLYFDLSGVAEDEMGFDDLGEDEINFQEVGVSDGIEDAEYSLTVHKAN